MKRPDYSSSPSTPERELTPTPSLTETPLPLGETNVEIGEPAVIGQRTLKPLGKEQAQEFVQQLQSIHSRQITYVDELEKQQADYMHVFRSMLAYQWSPELAATIFEESDFHTDLWDTYDYGLSDFWNTCPNRAHQVSLPNPYGEDKGMRASRISYGGQFAGIAMPGPVPDEMSQITEMLWQENAGVVVDLISDADRGGDFCREFGQRFNWDSISDEKPTKFGNGFSLQKCSERREDFDLEVTDFFGTRHQAYAMIRSFKLVGPGGEERIISQISFPSWPDGMTVPVDVMEKLQTLIVEEEALHPDRTLVVNCLAGVGRTGTVFAVRELYKRLLNGELREDNLNQIVLEILLEGKLCRNGDFVQRVAQACHVLDMAHRLVRSGADATALTQPIEVSSGSEFMRELGKLQSREDVKEANEEYEELLSKLMCEIVPDEIALTLLRAVPPVNEYTSCLYADPEQLDLHTDALVPLTHSQVVVGRETPQATRLAGNHMHLSGEYAGIAMQAPRTDELPQVLQAIQENNIGIVVDLATEAEHDPHGMYTGKNALLDWSKADQGIAHPQSSSKSTSETGFGATPESETTSPSLNKKSEQMWSFTVNGKDYRTIIRQFELVDAVSGSKRPMVQISFPDWPVGDVLPYQAIRKLVDLIEQFADKVSPAMLVHCVDGLDRTGTVFIGRDIHNSLKKNPEDWGMNGKLALKGIVESRLSRSNNMMKSYKQAYELNKLQGNLYWKP